MVPVFRYLGIPLDQQARDVTMIQSIHARGAGALGKMCDVLGSLQWHTVWTRLVLFDVYVRSCLTFGAPVWAPRAL